MDERTYVGSRTAARLLDVQVPTLIKWTRAGVVHGYLDPAGRYRFWVEDLRLALRSVQPSARTTGRGQ